MQIKKIGEFGLIDRLRAKLPELSGRVVQGIGDDAAVLQNKAGTVSLLTSDMLIEDIHFSLRYQPLKSIGWKALAVNISDIAAMGGRPGAAVVSIAFPAGWTVRQAEEIYEGLAQCAEAYGVDVVGGDTVRSPYGLVINIALTGQAILNQVTYRSGARPGDLIMVTGSLGRSAAGLHLLNHSLPDVPETYKDDVLKAHFFPRPRLREGLVLGESGYVTAMNDVSDGLASEILEICRASGVGCQVQENRIPVSEPVGHLSRLAGADALDWPLFGGEDYELVFTVKPEGAAIVLAALQEVGCNPTRMGIITSGPACDLVEGGRLRPLKPDGYNHFCD